MKDYKHPLGNIKIRFIKFTANAMGRIILFILSFFLKINKKKSEIIISSAIYAPWKDDIEFKIFSEKIILDTLLDLKRLYTLWNFSKSLKNKNGNILDIGCLKGGAGFVMSKINKKGNTYLIDTFDGLIENENYHKKEHFVFGDVEFVENRIKLLNLKNTKVIKGRFPKGAVKYIKGERFKLCHIDVNTYNSTKSAFNYVKNKIIKDGIIIFDDYGIYSTDGVKKFVDYISKKYSNEFTFINNYMGQCILIKK
tara:strand:+ start:1599 stop:2357 length:759 start_codon:yes stop_codon:yes gene_type:complete